jgi:hypothetical protein
LQPTAARQESCANEATFSPQGKQVSPAQFDGREQPQHNNRFAIAAPPAAMIAHFKMTARIRFELVDCREEESAAPTAQRGEVCFIRPLTWRAHQAGVVLEVSLISRLHILNPLPSPACSNPTHVALSDAKLSSDLVLGFTSSIAFGFAGLDRL